MALPEKDGLFNNPSPTPPCSMDSLSMMTGGQNFFFSNFLSRISYLNSSFYNNYSFSPLLSRKGLSLLLVYFPSRNG